MTPLPVPSFMKLLCVEGEAAWAGGQTRGRVGSLGWLSPTHCCAPSGEPLHLHSPWHLLASQAGAHSVPLHPAEVTTWHLLGPTEHQGMGMGVQTPQDCTLPRIGSAPASHGWHTGTGSSLLRYSVCCTKYGSLTRHKREDGGRRGKNNLVLVFLGCLRPVVSQPLAPGLSLAGLCSTA